MQRQQLVQNTLESNSNYAQKLANSTDDFLHSALQQLKISAQLLEDMLGDEQRLHVEAERLRLQTDSFNSVLIIDQNGAVQATSPESLQLTGLSLDSPGIQEALERQAPVISAPYLSTVGNFIVFISHPIFDKSGKYRGLVGGSLYLKKESILNRLLGHHPYKDGSYLYVVSAEKQVIYHPDTSRVGDVVEDNDVVNSVVQGQAGSMVLVNSQGITMLAGYAPVPLSGWGIVAQRPESATLEPLEGLMRQVINKTLPVAVISLLLVWWGARKIAKPLRLLAENARMMHSSGTESEISHVRSWYFEAHELKKALLMGMGFLKRNIEKLDKDNRTDPLTGLLNRRGLDQELRVYGHMQRMFSVISVDIDFFKKVNDTYGHDTGDIVLQELAVQMRNSIRSGDVACRIGGEEFLILLPGTGVDAAIEIAERLRVQVETTEMPEVGHITISLGVAVSATDGSDSATVLKQADEKLYQAKRNGRNRVEA
ncbi:sensor domain-containing diguanylate cyclase [Paenalcaligenes sp. Me131]|uniref:sensor domain-containing diguanylate cyclase n=1 Tax=Paenalcaligenes sp. Me131 TaxID=3392636 RepID=UPI003D2BF24A